MKCQRGDLSFIFNGDAPPSKSFYVLDNEQKVYQRIHHEVTYMVWYHVLQTTQHHMNVTYMVWYHVLQATQPYTNVCIALAKVD